MPPKQLAITAFFEAVGDGKLLQKGKRTLTLSPGSSSESKRNRLSATEYREVSPTMTPQSSTVSQLLQQSPIRLSNNCDSTASVEAETIKTDNGKEPSPEWPDSELAPIFSTLTETGWRSLLESELKKDYLKQICLFLEKQYEKGATVFPPRELIFNAFNLTPFHKIRVVLLGQDPYHNFDQAQGLCFSVPHGVPQPPSLRNIFKEMVSEYPGFTKPSHGCLESWARQGVFLLNATLTVEAHKANSHQKIGWQKFTDAVIKLVSDKSDTGVLFLLWGGYAHRKEALVDKRKHRVVKAAHPSPLSASKFLGCKCFTKANAQLKELGKEPINWTTL